MPLLDLLVQAYALGAYMENNFTKSKHQIRSKKKHPKTGLAQNPDTILATRLSDATLKMYEIQTLVVLTQPGALD